MKFTVKRLFTKKVTRIEGLIAGLIVFILLAVVAYFVVVGSWLNSISAEDYCSSFGQRESKADRPFGPEEIQKCMDNYKQGFNDQNHQ